MCFDISTSMAFPLNGAASVRCAACHLSSAFRARRNGAIKLQYKKVIWSGGDLYAHSSEYLK
jgi:hypothetical protein